jgi:hypothetical protein
MTVENALPRDMAACLNVECILRDCCLRAAFTELDHQSASSYTPKQTDSGWECEKFVPISNEDMGMRQ